MMLLAILICPGLALGQGVPRSGMPHPSLPECQASDPRLLLPDLVPDTPASVRTRLMGGERIVEFTSSIGNVGPGALLVEGITVTLGGTQVTVGYQLIDRNDGSRCARESGVFEYHPAHSHFHFDDFVGYEVRVGDPNLGPLVVTGEKASYCLIDMTPVRGFDVARHPLLRGRITCTEAEGIQGISVGFKDVYDRTLPGQLLSLDRPTSIPAGSYFIVNDVDPLGILWESNKANNRAASSFTVGGAAGPLATPSVVVPTATSTPRGTAPGGVSPTATPRLRPTAPRPPIAVRPTRPARPERPARATPTPRPGAPTATRPSTVPTSTRPGSVATTTPTLTPTATRVPDGGEVATNCDNACPYFKFSQMRLTWYDAASGGLNLSYYIQPGFCAPLTPQAGAPASIQMTRWLTHRQVDTGRSHIANFTLGPNGAGATSTGGTASISDFRSWQQVSYRATTPPIAGPQDGANFPVVFDLCLTVGNQSAKARMVCQEKNRGLLCHQG